MQVETNATVTYDVKKVSINNITIHKSNSGLIFMIPFEWIDSTDKKINRSMKRFTQQELVSLGTSINQDLTPIIAVLTGVLSSDNANLVINLNKAPVLSGVLVSKVNDKYIPTRLEGEEFTNAISPLTVETILGLIQMLSVYLTTV